MNEFRYNYFYGQKNKVELDGLARILHYLEYEGYKKLKLELEMSEKEFKNHIENFEIVPIDY